MLLYFESLIALGKNLKGKFRIDALLLMMCLDTLEVFLEFNMKTWIFVTDKKYRLFISKTTLFEVYKKRQILKESTVNNIVYSI